MEYNSGGNRAIDLKLRARLQDSAWMAGSWVGRSWVVGRGSWVVGPRLQLTDFPCTLTINVNNNSDLRMSNSPAYLP